MIWTLEVRRAEFLEALRRAVSNASKGRPELPAVFSFSDGHLTIEALGHKTFIPASGRWPGITSVPAAMLKRLASVPPEEDPLRLQATDEHFTISQTSLPCERRSTSPPDSDLSPQSLAVNASLHDILKLRASHRPEEIEAAGMTRTLSGAEKKVNEILEQAARILKTYHVSKGDVRSLVEKHISDDLSPFADAERPVIRSVAQVWSLLAPLGVEPGEIKVLIDGAIKNAWKR